MPFIITNERLIFIQFPKIFVSVRHFALPGQRTSDSVILKFYSIYHNTNCLVLFPSLLCEFSVLRTWALHLALKQAEVKIPHVCSHLRHKHHL